MLSKIIVIIISCIVLTPGAAFGHAEPLAVKIVGDQGEIVPSGVWGLEQEEDEDEDQVEIFSKKWFWMNFILFLSFSIAGIMSCFVCHLYKQELKQSLRL